MATATRVIKIFTTINVRLVLHIEVSVEILVSKEVDFSEIAEATTLISEMILSSFPAFEATASLRLARSTSCES